MTEQIDLAGIVTSNSVTVDRATAKVITFTLRGGIANPASSVSRAGMTVLERAPSQTAPVTMTYDGYGRLLTRNDPNSGAASMVVEYEPVFGQPWRTTQGPSVTEIEYYDAASSSPGQIRSRSVDGKVTRYDYENGRVKHTWGPAAYPLQYDYDLFGRLWKLHTFRVDSGFGGEAWPTGAGAGDVTEWVYESGTNRLSQKLDASGHGAGYSYDELGRLQTRTWARGVTATYYYNLAGDMKHIDYSGSTPDVTLGYDSRGRLSTRTDGAGTTTMVYDGETERVADEIGSDGSRLHREADGAGRETGYYLWDGSRFATWGGWGYDEFTGRMNGATTEAGWVSYEDWESPDVSSHLVTLVGANVSTEWRRDGSGRLQSLKTLVGAATPTPLAGRRYTYNGDGSIGGVLEGHTADGGQTWTNGGRWTYGYNGRGEVQTGFKTWAGGGFNPARLAAYSYYGYDAIGNRTDSTWGFSFSSNYTPNALNQYTRIDNAREAPVTGEADPLKAVRVNGNVVTNRMGRYFTSSVSGNPAGIATRPQWAPVSIQEGEDGQQPRESHGHIYLPPAQEDFIYDFDGNLTRDGRWTYTWDAENRLIAMETRWPAAQVPGLPQLRLEFAYDSLSRRVSKTVKERNAGNTWQTVRTLRFAYDGWNLIAESEPLNPSTGSGQTLNLVRTYNWGLDLSGSRQGAGGVGGLLLITQHHSTLNIQHSTSLYPCYGDNGNIEALLDVSDPQAGVTVAASYEYGPFGEPLRATGALARANPFRFSPNTRMRRRGCSTTAFVTTRRQWGGG